MKGRHATTTSQGVSRVVGNAHAGSGFDFILRTTYLPEPGAAAMLAAGAGLLLALSRRRARRTARARRS